MVANARNRFWPMPSKIPRFCCTSVLTDCKTASKKFMVSPCSWPSALWEPVIAQALGKVAVERREVTCRYLLHLHCEIEVGSVGIALLLSLQNLLFERSDTEVVRVLQGTKREHITRVDFVQVAHFRVEAPV